MALHQITPGLAGEYMQKLEVSAPTKNRALAALALCLSLELRSGRSPGGGNFE
jgi:hypothetical protein